MNEPTEYSESGQPVYRHEARERNWQLPDMEDSSLEEISDHIEKHLGPIESVFHEIISDLVHIDVHFVPPTEERPWITLVTSGMSDLPMSTPREVEGLDYAELMIELPPDWPLGEEEFKNERNYWPIRNLKMMARLPHEYETWLAYGHTVPNGDPPEPFAPGTELCCMLVEMPITTSPEFASLTIREDKEINFWSLMPLYREEMELKLRKGTEALEDLFEKHEIAPVVDPYRKNVARRKRFGLF